MDTQEEKVITPEETPVETTDGQKIEDKTEKKIEDKTEKPKMMQVDKKQDMFLLDILKDKVPIKIQFMNGLVLPREIMVGFSNFAIFTETDKEEMMIYKHSIAGIIRPRRTPAHTPAEPPKEEAAPEPEKPVEKPVEKVRKTRTRKVI